MRHVSLALTLLLLTACPGPATGPTPGGTYFWRITSSTIEFGACSDEPTFREGLKPVPFGPSSFVVYRVAADGKTAATQDCSRLDAQSCTTPPDADIYDISGFELTRSETFKNPIQNSTCMLSQNINETIVEDGRKMTFDLVSILTLTDAPADCENVEKGLQQNSPNGLGVEGCVVTRRLTGDLE
ncbi:MAG: hypothetical protein ACO1OB_28300 [Archangium sp.]